MLVRKLKTQTQFYFARDDTEIYKKVIQLYIQSLPDPKKGRITPKQSLGTFQHILQIKVS